MYVNLWHQEILRWSEQLKRNGLNVLGSALPLSITHQSARHLHPDGEALASLLAMGKVLHRSDIKAQDNLTRYPPP